MPSRYDMLALMLLPGAAQYSATCSMQYLACCRLAHKQAQDKSWLKQGRQTCAHLFLLCGVMVDLTVLFLPAGLQAELVAQFLCCIPLAAVDAFLSWLRPIVPDQEQEQLRTQVCSGNLKACPAFRCAVEACWLSHDEPFGHGPDMSHLALSYSVRYLAFDMHHQRLSICAAIHSKWTHQKLNLLRAAAYRMLLLSPF